MDIKDFCTGIQHVGIPTNDIKNTIQFYEDLGFDTEFITSKTGEIVAFMRLFDLEIEVYNNKKAVLTNGAIDHIAIDVMNIDKLFELVKSKDLKLLTPEIQSLPLWSKGVKFFTIEGPNKEKIEFCEKIR